MVSWDIHKSNIHEKWKKQWFTTHPYEIAEYSWTYLFTGGKEIRSKLFCELWNYLSPDSEIIAELAFAIECIHVASLILDDTPWMDNAKERRGRTTLHIVFSPKKALLIANDIISVAVNIWINNKPDHVAEDIWKSLLISKLQRLAMGQWMDLGKTGTLVELASLKTGVLFELVTETVALCNNLDANFWRIWGNNLGILFQWVDDWIDRDEDILQQNRNAFNEAFDNTFQIYINIWNKLEKHIGTQWFHYPFGIFMKKYFIEQLNINNRINIISSLGELFTFEKLWTVEDDKCKQYINHILTSELTNPDIEQYPRIQNLITELNHTIIIERIFYVSNMLFEISIPQTKLWSMEEDTWELYIQSILPKDNLEYYIRYEMIPKINNYAYPIIYNREKIYEILHNMLQTSPPTSIWTDKWEEYIDNIKKIMSELTC